MVVDIVGERVRQRWGGWWFQLNRVYFWGARSEFFPHHISVGVWYCSDSSIIGFWCLYWLNQSSAVRFGLFLCFSVLMKMAVSSFIMRMVGLQWGNTEAISDSNCLRTIRSEKNSLEDGIREKSQFWSICQAFFLSYYSIYAAFK